MEKRYEYQVIQVGAKTSSVWAKYDEEVQAKRKAAYYRQQYIDSDFRVIKVEKK